MAVNRKPKEPESTTTEPNSSITTAKIARECGLYGLNVLETEAFCADKLNDTQLMRAYSEGKAEHAYSVMRAIYEGAVYEKKERLLIWLAETSLRKHIDAQVETNVFSAMTPEQRREEIRKLTKKCALNG